MAMCRLSRGCRSSSGEVVATAFLGGRSECGSVGPRMPEQSPMVGCGIEKDACDMWKHGA
eukprot:974092-Pyramimonas_sp.AAC.2